MDLNSITPVGPRVLIKPYEGAKVSSAGLIMENTSNATTAPVRGTVVSSGDESKFKKGQDLMFRRYSTDILKIMTKDGEKEVMLVEDIDILAVVKNKK